MSLCPTCEPSWIGSKAHLVKQLEGLTLERNFYRAKAAEHHERAQRAEALASMAMREGLAACEELRNPSDGRQLEIRELNPR